MKNLAFRASIFILIGIFKASWGGSVSPAKSTKCGE